MQKLVTDFLKSVNDPLSLFVLRFFKRLLTNYKNLKIRTHDIELENNPEKVCSRISYKIFI